MKKFKVLALAFIATCITCIVITSSLSLSLLAISIFLLFYLGTMWVLDFDLSFAGYVTNLLFPSLILTTITVAIAIYVPRYSYLFPAGADFFSYFLLIIFILGFSSYALIISMNIFNVSRYKRLPLLQAAQTVIYVFSFAGGYLLLNLIHHFYSSTWFILLPLYLLTSGYLFFINNWSIKLGNKENLIYSLLGMFIIFQISVVLLFFPLIYYIYPLAITLCIYIFNGILIHAHKRISLRRAAYEYLTLGIIMVTIIFLTSHWGIAGNIIGL